MIMSSDDEAIAITSSSPIARSIASSASKACAIAAAATVTEEHCSPFKLSNASEEGCVGILLCACCLFLLVPLMPLLVPLRFFLL